MNQRRTRWAGAGRAGRALVLLALLLICGCAGQTPRTPRIFAMGERVEVGPLVYIVQDTEWQDRLGEGALARVPEHRFLLVRLSVTNSGIQETDIPPLALVASDGRTYGELSRGESVPGWLGYLRTLRPAATEHGRVVFDAPTGAYRLRVAALGKDDEETHALIDLPYQGTPGLQIPLVSPGFPSP